jgi:hypothetical protein
LQFYIARLERQKLQLSEGKRTETKRKMKRWRWHFCGLINFLQLFTAVTFMVLQFIVSYCCNEERKSEKSFLALRERKRKMRRKNRTFHFNKWLCHSLSTLGSYFRAFFLCSVFPPHSFITSDLVRLTKQWKQIKKTRQYCLLSLNRSLKIISWG